MRAFVLCFCKNPFFSSSFRHVDAKTQEGLSRIISIWRERGAFDGEFLTEIESQMKGVASETQEPIDAALLAIPVDVCKQCDLYCVDFSAYSLVDVFGLFLDCFFPCVMSLRTLVLGCLCVVRWPLSCLRGSTIHAYCT